MSIFDLVESESGRGTVKKEHTQTLILLRCRGINEYVFHHHHHDVSVLISNWTDSIHIYVTQIISQLFILSNYLIGNNPIPYIYLYTFYIYMATTDDTGKRITQFFFLSSLVFKTFSLPVAVIILHMCSFICILIILSFFLSTGVFDIVVVRHSPNQSNSIHRHQYMWVVLEKKPNPKKNKSTSEFQFDFKLSEKRINYSWKTITGGLITASSG